jgi:hypothetical protein
MVMTDEERESLRATYEAAGLSGDLKSTYDRRRTSRRSEDKELFDQLKTLRAQVEFYQGALESYVIAAAESAARKRGVN